MLRPDAEHPVTVSRRQPQPADRQRLDVRRRHVRENIVVQDRARRRVDGDGEDHRAGLTENYHQAGLRV